MGLGGVRGVGGGADPGKPPAGERGGASMRAWAWPGALANAWGKRCSARGQAGASAGAGRGAGGLIPAERERGRRRESKKAKEGERDRRTECERVRTSERVSERARELAS